MKKKLVPFIAVLLLTSCTEQPRETKEVAKTDAIVTDPLPSWNDGSSKKSIVDFVNKTTKEGGADFIPVADRIACFRQ